jgi:hypothetical protein
VARGAGRSGPDRVVEPVRDGLAPRCGSVGHDARAGGGGGV